MSELQGSLIETIDPVAAVQDLVATIRVAQRTLSLEGRNIGTLAHRERTDVAESDCIFCGRDLSAHGSYLRIDGRRMCRRPCTGHPVSITTRRNAR